MNLGFRLVSGFSTIASKLCALDCTCTTKMLHASDIWGGEKRVSEYTWQSSFAELSMSCSHFALSRRSCLTLRVAWSTVRLKGCVVAISAEKMFPRSGQPHVSSGNQYVLVRVRLLHSQASVSCIARRNSSIRFASITASCFRSAAR